MADSPDLDRQIGMLRAAFWSERDPEGRAFAPLADAYRKRGELDEAAALVSDGLGRHPQFATGHLVASRVARDLGDHLRAREHLDRVLDLDSGNVMALVERAECSLAEGDRDGALMDLRDALRVEPANDGIRARLQAAEEGEPSQRPGPAGADPLAADEHVTEGLILTRTMADIYARQGFVDEAVQVYEHLLRESPGDESLSARLAELRAGAARSEDSASEVVPVWNPDYDAVPEPIVRESTPSIGQYFEDLLAWVPGAVPIDSLAPGAVSDPIPIESLAPDVVPESEEPREPREDGPERAVTAEPMDDFTKWLKGLGT